MSKIYVDDVGTEFQVDVGVDITGATTAELKVTKPDGSLVTWAGTENGTRIDYTIETDDLDLPGRYRLNAYVETATWSGHGETAEFVVYEVGK